MSPRRRERKSGRPAAFWDIIEKVFGRSGLKGRIKENQVFTVWERAVGEGIVKNARPVAVREGVLTIEARNNTWMQELSLLREDLIRELNTALGWEAIRELRFRVADSEIAPARDVGTNIKPSPKRVDVKTAGDIERHLDEISDPEMRKALRGLMERGAAKK